MHLVSCTAQEKTLSHVVRRTLPSLSHAAEPLGFSRGPSTVGSGSLATTTSAHGVACWSPGSWGSWAGWATDALPDNQPRSAHWACLRLGPPPGPLSMGLASVFYPVRPVPGSHRPRRISQHPSRSRGAVLSPEGLRKENSTSHRADHKTAQLHDVCIVCAGQSV